MKATKESTEKQPNFIPCTGTFWTQGVDELECSYADLVKAFGEPNAQPDGYKESTRWHVRDTRTGARFSIYDWKETVLYSSNGCTVEQLRARTKVQWHIGAKEAFGRLPEFDRQAFLETLRCA